MNQPLLLSRLHQPPVDSRTRLNPVNKQLYQTQLMKSYIKAIHSPLNAFRKISEFLLVFPNGDFSEDSTFSVRILTSLS